MSVSKVLGIFCLALILLVTATGTGFAQDGQPPKPPEVPVTPHFPPGQYLPTGNQFGRALQAKSAVNALALTLGTPGLSYRYVDTFGTTGEPYIADTAHLNRPNGLFMDGSNNLYVTEESGNRVLKYNSSGSNLLALGTAGVCSTGDYTFCSPSDVALDGSGNNWVADGNRVVEYDANGTFIQQLPETEAWNSGSDNTHFNWVNGIAFDSLGRMFVSDTNNQRVQVYTFTAGAPVYSATLGVTGVSGSDNTHFNFPYSLTVDSSNRLYVIDRDNNRVQRCTFSAGWTCTTFDSGLNSPQGITKDGSNNIFVADTFNGRIRKCSSAGVCTDFVTGTNWPYDVAVDSSGNIYTTAKYEGIVLKYNSSGGLVGTFLGTEFVPYLTDSYHYFHPRVAIDNSNNIIIVEENGQRLTKLNASGVAQWSFGVPGVDASDNSHFTYPHGVATDSSGKIYVADNCRVQIISPTGSYLNTLGTGCGTGNYEFGWVTGVDVNQQNGNIYVADYPNHRVQIYNSSRTYLATIGETGVSGSDNNHLNNPIAVAIDAGGNIYVTDGGNGRVQKFNSNGVWQMTIGDGTWGASFSQLSWPEDVVVDAQGRIFVTDWTNNRVQVFDSNGAYLTTIAGSWGANTSQLEGAPGVAIDSSGNVYAADWENHRIQKFAPGVPGWQQKNINGFGDLNNNTVNRMSVFNGYLYAGVANETTGGEVWRSSDGSNWSQVNLDGFGDANNTYAQLGKSFNGNMYVGTLNSATGGEIWRCTICDGTDWSQVASGGFGDINNTTVEQIVVLSNNLYATVNNSVTGVEVWKSSAGNSGSWIQVNTDGFGDVRNTGLWAATVFNDYLYAFTAQWGGPWDTGTYTGGEVWRTNNGTTWTQVNADGFGERDNMGHWLESFNGYLYALTWNFGSGTQMWRCATCDGTDWNRVVSDGFGDVNNVAGSYMLSFGSHLYVGTHNELTGTEIWQTANGTSWSQINVDGHGDSNNIDTRSGAVFNGSLFFTSLNWANGTEIWGILPPVDVNIGGTMRGSYFLTAGQSTRQNYAGVDSGPVKVMSTGVNPIISAIRDAWAVNGVTTSFSQLMGLPQEQLSDTYVFPGYNNVTLNDQLRIANIDASASTVVVTIGGTVRGTYPLAAGEAVRINYPGLDSGPVVVKGTSGVKIIAAIREAWAVNGTTTSFVQLMGLPAGQLSNKYVFPAYNNVTLNEQLRIGNVDPTQSTSVTVTIGGTVRGTYPLGPGGAVRVNYAGLDSGPVIVEGTAGVNIISSIRSAWAVNGVTTSFAQLMGMPAEQISDKYVFPGYNNVTLNDQIRIANVDTVPTTVTVTIGGTLRGTYPLAAGEPVRINYPGLDSGPVVVQGTSGVKIISSIREAWAVNGVTKSFVQLMGLPAQQLSTTYWFPAYNNVTLNEQLRIGMP